MKNSPEALKQLEEANRIYDKDYAGAIEMYKSDSEDVLRKYGSTAEEFATNLATTSRDKYLNNSNKVIKQYYQDLEKNTETNTQSIVATQFTAANPTALKQLEANLIAATLPYVGGNPDKEGGVGSLSAKWVHSNKPVEKEDELKAIDVIKSTRPTWTMIEEDGQMKIKLIYEPIKETKSGTKTVETYQNAIMVDAPIEVYDYLIETGQLSATIMMNSTVVNNLGTKAHPSNTTRIKNQYMDISVTKKASTENSSVYTIANNKQKVEGTYNTSGEALQMLDAISAKIINDLNK
jgi:hypothetical protein